MSKMTKKENAELYFSDGFTCSQAVFTVFGKESGLTEDQCLKMGTAFGGGMARNQFTCGAVTGALMVIGLIYGRGLNDGIDKKEVTYQKSNEFLAEFQKKHGSLVCKDLLNGLNMNDPEDLKEITKLELFQTACNKYVGDAVVILERILE
jgi:C_GCAxxG_C_C family probable redox protein